MKFNGILPRSPYRLHGVSWLLISNNAQRNHYNLNNPWKPLYLFKLYIFFSYLIYMSIHRESDIEYYWRTLFSAKELFYDVREHMDCTRF
jgi:hypothetical protein